MLSFQSKKTTDGSYLDRMPKEVVQSLNLLDSKKTTLQSSKSAAPNEKRRNVMSRAVRSGGAGLLHSSMVASNTVTSPSPGQYDNFKLFYDRSKQRCFTIGKKFQEPKGDARPGPANYDTRERRFATLGGAGTRSGHKYSFGT